MFKYMTTDPFMDDPGNECGSVFDPFVVSHADGASPSPTVGKTHGKAVVGVFLIRATVVSKPCVSLPDPKWPLTTGLVTAISNSKLRFILAGNGYEPGNLRFHQTVEILTIIPAVTCAAICVVVHQELTWQSISKSRQLMNNFRKLDECTPSLYRDHKMENKGTVLSHNWQTTHLSISKWFQSLFVIEIILIHCISFYYVVVSRNYTSVDSKIISFPTSKWLWNQLVYTMLVLLIS